MAVAITSETTGYVGETGALVCELVRRHRAAGLKQAHAIAAAAGDLGLSPRRVRSYWYGEVLAVLVDEYFAVRGRFVQHLARETARLEAESKLLDARRAALNGGPS